MIKQVFHVERFWKVIVYWNVDYNFFDKITEVMQELGIDEEDIKEIWDMMSHRKAKAVTYSNLRERVSLVLFNTHHSIKDYLNSVVHEAEHVKQAMLKVYQIGDEGEPPAYTVGYLVGRMCEVFCNFI